MLNRYCSCRDQRVSNRMIGSIENLLVDSSHTRWAEDGPSYCGSRDRLERSDGHYVFRSESWPNVYRIITKLSAWYWLWDQSRWMKPHKSWNIIPWIPGLSMKMIPASHHPLISPPSRAAIATARPIYPWRDDGPKPHVLLGDPATQIKPWHFPLQQSIFQSRDIFGITVDHLNLVQQRRRQDLGQFGWWSYIGNDRMIGAIKAGTRRDTSFPLPPTTSIRICGD